ncbi:kinase-like domain-containing protein [Sphaerosporella brunnea]|uniref:non-specific serine/threonine protein kinase n=1 Tax=Sphaerosporella brunnea TaxID=1250544 RepID=A0A5J5EQ54_9PEZI|nr:kinase-like domain-containing protein [Sphaerosporella brunnea]
MHDIERQDIVGEGESFVVEKSVHAGEIVAVKHLKMCQLGSNLGHRLDKVLLDLQIMHHKPLRNHPNILRLIGYGWNTQVNNQPMPFIVVEYTHMGSFREYLRLRQGDTTLDNKFIFIGDVAAGLTALHDCGIVHGDLKLDNVLAFPSRDRPSNVVAKICDFGHSLVLSQDEHQHKRYCGTSRYNAPEVADQSHDARSSQDLDLQKCDIWAYGLLMWEVLKDGDCYFDKSWTQDRSHFTDFSGALEAASDDLSFSRFDKSHLRELARGFLKEKFGSMHSVGTGSKLSTAIFCGFLVKTLHMDPAQRPSDLKDFPLLTAWNKLGKAKLSTLLSMHSGKSELTYEVSYPR